MHRTSVNPWDEALAVDMAQVDSRATTIVHKKL